MSQWHFWTSQMGAVWSSWPHHAHRILRFKSGRVWHESVSVSEYCPQKYKYHSHPTFQCTVLRLSHQTGFRKSRFDSKREQWWVHHPCHGVYYWMNIFLPCFYPLPNQDRPPKPAHNLPCPLKNYLDRYLQVPSWFQWWFWQFFVTISWLFSFSAYTLLWFLSHYGSRGLRHVLNSYWGSARHDWRLKLIPVNT